MNALSKQFNLSRLLKSGLFFWDSTVDKNVTQKR